MTNRKNISPADNAYQQFSENICNLLENARKSAGRAVNAILTASYWEIGRRIVEFEQKGRKRAEYGSGLLSRLSSDLVKKIRTGIFRAESATNEVILHIMAETADTVCGICQR